MSMTSAIRYIFAADTSSVVGAGKTGLAFGDFTVKYLAEGGTLTSLTTETITTLGTYQAPTSAAHIRIKELAGSDPTKGIYEVHFHNTQVALAGNNLWLMLSASGAAIAPLWIPLYDIQGRIPTAVPGAADGLVIAGTNTPIKFTGPGNAFEVISTSNGHGIYAQGNGANEGFHAQGGATGGGIMALAGASGGAGIRAQAQAGNNPGVYAIGSGNEAGLNATGGNTGDGIKATAGTGGLDIRATIFVGITSLAQWLGLGFTKKTGNATARTELNATGAGSGTFDETTDSQEALRDRGDAAWITATGFAVPGSEMDIVDAPNATGVNAIRDAVHAGTVLFGTVDAGATTTSIPIKTLDVTLTDADQLKGRVILFSKSTGSAALQGQGAPIYGSTTTHITLAAGDALSSAPATDDIFRIV